MLVSEKIINNERFNKEAFIPALLSSLGNAGLSSAAFSAIYSGAKGLASRLAPKIYSNVAKIPGAKTIANKVVPTLGTGGTFASNLYGDFKSHNYNQSRSALTDSLGAERNPYIISGLR